MTWPEGVALELVLLGIGWIGFQYLTRDIRSFFELRHEVRRQMQRSVIDPSARSDTQWMRPGANPHAMDDPRVEQGAEAFRQLGFRILMFAQNARLAAWAVRTMGYDPIKAGDSLISLSHDAGLAFRRKAIANALRFEESDDDN
jgi:hypothetical protein